MEFQGLAEVLLARPEREVHVLQMLLCYQKANGPQNYIFIIYIKSVLTLFLESRLLSKILEMTSLSMGYESSRLYFNEFSEELIFFWLEYHYLFLSII